MAGPTHIAAPRGAMRVVPETRVGASSVSSYIPWLWQTTLCRHGALYRWAPRHPPTSLVRVAAPRLRPLLRRSSPAPDAEHLCNGVIELPSQAYRAPCDYFSFGWWSKTVLRQAHGPLQPSGGARSISANVSFIAGRVYGAGVMGCSCAVLSRALYTRLAGMFLPRQAGLRSFALLRATAAHVHIS